MDQSFSSDKDMRDSTEDDAIVRITCLEESKEEVDSPIEGETIEQTSIPSNVNDNNRRFSCSILTKGKSSIHGLLEISSYFLSFHATVN